MGVLGAAAAVVVLLSVGALALDLDGLVADLQALNSTAVRPSDAAFPLAVRQFVDLFNNVRPALVVFATNERAVQVAVNFSATYGVRVSARSGGNSNLGSGVCDGCIVVDVSRMDSIVTDLPHMTVRVGPGVTNRMMVDVSLLGLAVPQGDCPMVRLGGYAVGGGLALSSRVLGMNVDAVTEFRVVDPQGRLLVANATSNADLFWALRGGGGINFGIVVSLLYQAAPLPPQMLGGYIGWPLEMADQVARLYYDVVWGRNSSGGKNDPFGFSLAFVPGPQGRTELRLAGLWYSSDLARGNALLAPFRALPGPSADTIRPGVFADLMQPLMDQYDTFAHLNWTMPDAMIAVPASADVFADFLVTIVKQISLMPPDCFVTWVFAPLGGKVNAVPSNHTAFPHRTSGGNFHMPTIWLNSAAEASVRAFGQQSLAALAKFYQRSSAYPNLRDPLSYVNHPSLYLTDYPHAYWDANYPRLQQIKAKYDPLHLFSNGQGVQPTMMHK